MQLSEIKQRVDLTGKVIFITGVAGFIGSFLAKRLFEKIKDIEIVGIDNMNNYYDVSLKEERLIALENNKKFIFVKGDLADKSFIFSLFEEYRPTVVVNLAAQAGVRYSITMEKVGLNI